MKHRRLAVAALALLAVPLACGGDDDGAEAGGATTASPVTTAPATTAPSATEPPSTTEEPTATTSPLDDRDQLRLRLAAELRDEALANKVVDGFDEQALPAVVALADGDIAGSPKLSYTPTRVDPAEVDSLWVFAYGYRLAPGVEPPSGGAIPPPDQLVPGPVNEALAELAAEFVAEHPVPVFTQVEVGEVLADLGVDDVTVVGPDIAPDGTVTYLSTAGVVEKGLRLAEEAGIEVGRIGVLCQADHAVRCLLTAQEQGLQADVPEGVELPAQFDPQSGQPWTRSRDVWIPTDLAARTLLAG